MNLRSEIWGGGGRGWEWNWRYNATSGQMANRWKRGSWECGGDGCWWQGFYTVSPPIVEADCQPNTESPTAGSFAAMKLLPLPAPCHTNRGGHSAGESSNKLSINWWVCHNCIPQERCYKKKPAKVLNVPWSLGPRRRRWAEGDGRQGLAGGAATGSQRWWGCRPPVGCQRDAGAGFIFCHVYWALKILNIQNFSRTKLLAKKIDSKKMHQSLLEKKYCAANICITETRENKK